MKKRFRFIVEHSFDEIMTKAKAERQKNELMKAWSLSLRTKSVRESIILAFCGHTSLPHIIYQNKIRSSNSASWQITENIFFSFRPRKTENFSAALISRHVTLWIQISKLDQSLSIYSCQHFSSQWLKRISLMGLFQSIRQTAQDFDPERQETSHEWAVSK